MVLTSQKRQWPNGPANLGSNSFNSDTNAAAAAAGAAAGAAAAAAGVIRPRVRRNRALS